MKFFEVKGETVFTGWPIDKASGAPAVELGARGRAHRLARIPLNGEVTPMPCPRRGMDNIPYEPINGLYQTALKCKWCDTLMTRERPKDPARPWDPSPVQETAPWKHPDEGMMDESRVFTGSLSRYDHLWKLSPSDVEGEACAVLVRDQSGYRGTWELHGDPYRCANSGKSWSEVEMVDYHCSLCSRKPGYLCDSQYTHHQWSYGTAPRVLVEGYLGQGDAGRAGGGPEVVFVLQKGQGFSVLRGGRLYGKSAVTWYVFDGKELRPMRKEDWPHPSQPDETFE